ncbi:DegT/DnrJ/EryC1/StrS aminotransferase family protein [Salinifilum ghardaiensis]
MSNDNALAIRGGPATVRTPLPHEIWPPPSTEQERAELAAQRDTDISIRGSSGPVEALEDEFLDLVDRRSRYAITFNSGTSALLAAYFALGVTEGVEVVGPALTYHAALSPAYALRGDVRLADVDVRTRCLDIDSAERLITDRTRVLVAVHQWGHPCDMDQVERLANKYNLKVLEDCSHAHGSRYRGRPVGTFSDAAVFSLQANKAVFAGEGGVLVTDRADVHDRAVLLGHYRDRSRDNVVDDDQRRYWVTGLGLKLRMSPFNAIVARHSLRAFDERKTERHRCLQYFSERLSEIDYIEPVVPAPEVDMGAWYGYKPLFRPERMPGVDRATLIEALRAEGVEVGAPSAPHLASLPLYHSERNALFPEVAQHANTTEHTPNAVTLERRALSLPTFTDWERDRPIIDEYAAAFAKVGEHRDELARSIAA